MFTKIIMIAIVEIMIKIAMPNVYAVVMIKRFENTVLHFDIANTLCILKK